MHRRQSRHRRRALFKQRTSAAVVVVVVAVADDDTHNDEEGWPRLRLGEKAFRNRSLTHRRRVTVYESRPALFAWIGERGSPYLHWSCP